MRSLVWDQVFAPMEERVRVLVFPQVQRRVWSKSFDLVWNQSFYLVIRALVNDRVEKLGVR